MSRVFGSTNSGDIVADDIICKNITATGRATFDGEIDICSAVLVGETIIDAELAGTTTLSGGHVFVGDFQSNNRITVQTSAGRAITTLTGGSSDWFMGFQGWGTDTTGYTWNGNTGVGSDFGLILSGLDGTDTTTQSTIAQFHSKASGYGGIGNNAIRFQSSLDVDERIATAKDLVVAGESRFTGDASFNGIVSFTGSLVDTGDLLVTGNQVVEGDLSVNGLIRGNVNLTGETFTDTDLAGTTTVVNGSRFYIGDLSGCRFLSEEKPANSSPNNITRNIDFGATADIRDIGTIHASSDNPTGSGGGILTVNVRIAATVSKPFTRTIIMENSNSPGPSQVTLNINTYTDPTFSVLADHIIVNKTTLTNSFTASIGVVFPSGREYNVYRLTCVPQIGGFSSSRTLVYIESLVT